MLGVHTRCLNKCLNQTYKYVNTDLCLYTSVNTDANYEAIKLWGYHTYT